MADHTRRSLSLEKTRDGQGAGSPDKQERTHEEWQFVNIASEVPREIKIKDGQGRRSSDKSRTTGKKASLLMKDQLRDNYCAAPNMAGTIHGDITILEGYIDPTGRDLSGSRRSPSRDQQAERSPDQHPSQSNSLKGSESYEEDSFHDASSDFDPS